MLHKFQILGKGRGCSRKGTHLRIRSSPSRSSERPSDTDKATHAWKKDNLSNLAPLPEAEMDIDWKTVFRDAIAPYLGKDWYKYMAVRVGFFVVLLLWAISHPWINAAIVRIIFTTLNFHHVFAVIFVYSLPLCVTSLLVFFISAIFSKEPLPGNFLYAIDFAYLSVPFVLYELCQIWALFLISLSDFIVISFLDYAIGVVLGLILLRRIPPAGQVLAALTICLVIPVFIFVDYGNFAVHFVGGDYNWYIGLGLAVLSRLFYCIYTIFARFLILFRSTRRKKAAVKATGEAYDPEIHVHLFDELPIVELCRLDVIFDHALFDLQPLGISLYRTLELSSLGGGLVLCPLAAMLALVNNEGDAVYSSFQSTYWNLNGLLTLCALVAIACLFVLHPVVSFHALTRNPIPEVWGVLAFTFLLVATVSIAVLQESWTLIQLWGAFLLAFCTLWYLYSMYTMKNRMRARNELKLLAKAMPSLAAADSYELQDIQSSLGDEVFYRTAFETIETGNPRAWEGLGSKNSVVSVRGLLDRDYGRKNSTLVE
jgi:hypothetical protein